MYSDGELDVTVEDKSDDALLKFHRLTLGSDGEGNVVHDRNGNVDVDQCHDDSDNADFPLMLGCRSAPSVNHKMVITAGGFGDELLPGESAVIAGSGLWSNDVGRQDRKLLSDGSAACKKLCANFCGKIMDLQDDCEVTSWTVLPVKQEHSNPTDARCELKTCGKINTKQFNFLASEDNVHRQGADGVDNKVLCGEAGTDSATWLAADRVAGKTESSILVSHSTHNSNSLSPAENPSSASSKRVASKSAKSSESHHHCRAGRKENAASKVVEVYVPDIYAKPADEIGTGNVKNSSGPNHHLSCNGPCGKKTVHKVRHSGGRKNRAKSKSMGEAVELKLKVSRRHEPCQLVSCTPLTNERVLAKSPLSDGKSEQKLGVDNVVSDVGSAELDSSLLDSRVFTPVKTHSKRSLAKTMSVCLDDSVASSSHHHVRRYGYDYDSEPIHMTLEEVKTSLQRLYGQKGLTMSVTSNAVATSSSSSSTTGTTTTTSSPHCGDNHACYLKSVSKTPTKKSGGPFHIHLRPKKVKDGSTYAETKERLQNRKSFPSSIKQTFCSLFGTAKKTAAVSSSVATDEDEDEEDNDLPVSVSNRVHSKSSEELSSRNEDDTVSPNLLNTPSRSIPSLSPFVNRALPPLPLTQNGEKSLEDRLIDMEDNTINCDDWDNEDEEPLDFTASIQQVKDYGWYWGPISGELAEKILANEPDGSFIVRDSSDEHYIFSLTFKLNGLVRHVRIEHDQGNFSFGTFTNFKSQTIVGFIENAVKHSRSGRYLFFLHRRPVLGPMRVQLLHPVSRFKQVQSLQHMCRFVILKAVRRDLIYSLPLPKRLKDYLNTPQYYTEDIDGASDDDHSTSHNHHPAVTPEQNLLHGAMPEADR